MKILSVKTTQLPTGERIQWVSGMPKHPYKAMDSELFNRWALYVHNQVTKFKGFNKVKPGGVAYIDGQESALRLAKEILG
jgi:hypothetical protein